MMTSKKRTGNENLEGVKTGMGEPGRGDSLGSAKAPGGSSGSVNSDYMSGRRSVLYEMTDHGLLSSQKLAMEILYLLPDYFVDFYSDVFHRALRVDDSSVMHGRSGGLGKAAGEMGMVTGSDTKLQASGSGKKWKNTPMAIASEHAMAMKTMLDRGLIDLVREVNAADQEKRKAELSRSMSDGAGLTGDMVGGSSLGIRCKGFVPRTREGEGNIRCGRYMKAGWGYCPNCGTRIEQG